MNENDAILFLGDVLTFKPVKFRSNYKSIINLEGPLVKDGKPAMNKIALKMENNYLNEIFGSNLLSVNLGNNHILDYGIDGLTSTLKELNESKTHFFGTSGPSAYHSNPSIIEFSNIKIALFSFVCKSTSALVSLEDVAYLEWLDLELIRRKVSEVRKEVNKVVVSIHWGIEDCSYPKKEDVILARKLIDNGVDIIIGNHTHAPQPIEKYNNGIIAYSLGNFITPNLKKLPTYHNAEGEPQSSFTKYLMLWNRISWGLLIDMHTLQFRVKRFIYLGNRIIELPLTPIDRYIRLKKDPFNNNYEEYVNKHLKRRKLIRKLIDFVISPHVPEKIKRIL